MCIRSMFSRDILYDLAFGKVDLHLEMQVVEKPEQPMETEPTDFDPACTVTKSTVCKVGDNEEMKKKVLPQSNEISPQEKSLNTVATDLPSMKEAVSVQGMASSSPLSRIN